MKFEEEFPSLKKRTFIVHSFEPHNIGDSVGATIEAKSNFIMEVDDVGFKELSNPTVPIPHLVLDCDIQKHCLDKQRVREVIRKYYTMSLRHTRDMPQNKVRELLERIKRDVGLK